MLCKSSQVAQLAIQSAGLHNILTYLGSIHLSEKWYCL